MAEWRRPAFALTALVIVTVAGTVGYIVLGFGLLDAIYQTVTTVTTVGFREVQPLTTAGKVFTIALIVVGVGTALYTLGVIIETLLEGQLPEVFGRRRMERKITGMSEHVVVCGWGRVGRAIARDLAAMGGRPVVVDKDPIRVEHVPYPAVLGDATDDDVLDRAGVPTVSSIRRASAGRGWPPSSSSLT
jgi:voltage-gated potassium channel